MSEENAAANSRIRIHYIICECGETFPSENALKSHLEKEHPRKRERKEYKCGVCYDIFDTKINCIKHYEEMHFEVSTAAADDELYDDEPTNEMETHGTELTSTVNKQYDLGTEYVNGQEMYGQMEEEFIIEDPTGSYGVQQNEEVAEAFNEEEVGELEGEYVNQEDFIGDEYDEGLQIKEELEEGEIPLEEGEIPIYHIEMPKPKMKRGRRIIPKGRLPKGERTITCEVCGKHYASNAALRYHQRTHTGERPYKCHICPKAFTMPLFLQIHVRCHTGERPFQCSHCDKAFSNKAALLRHDRVHTGEKPYKCPMCAKTFTQSNSMKLHVTTVHLKQPTPYKSKNRKLKALEHQNSVMKVKPNPRKKLPVVVDSVDVLRNGLESYVLGPLKTDLEKFKSDIDRLTSGEFESDMERISAVGSIEKEASVFEVVESEVMYDDERGYCEVVCAGDEIASG